MCTAANYLKIYYCWGNWRPLFVWYFWSCVDSYNIFGSHVHSTVDESCSTTSHWLQLKGNLKLTLGKCSILHTFLDNLHFRTELFIHYLHPWYGGYKLYTRRTCCIRWRRRFYFSFIFNPILGLYWSPRGYQSLKIDTSGDWYFTTFILVTNNGILKWWILNYCELYLSSLNLSLSS